MISDSIKKIVQYGIEKGLLPKEEKIYAINNFLELFKLDEYIESEKIYKNISLEEVLNELLDYAYENGLIKENSIVYRDLFDTKIMNILIPRPKQVIDKFYSLHNNSPQSATNYYYKLNQASNYIRRYRTEKNIKWTANTEYGNIDIIINLSESEKNEKEIAELKDIKQNGYPKCLLCKENEGYSGKLNHPSRQNHRIIPINIDNQDWGFQYSPYAYYNEHCIAFNYEHTPMKIDKSTFVKLFGFINFLPHYFVGSNADLPIVGASILSHEHFQGGNYNFPIADAKIEKNFKARNFEGIEMGILKWPMTVIRTRCSNENRLIELGDYILNKWRNYTDENAFIYAHTNNKPHNTITPIARKVNNTYELDLVLRNNITTDKYPLGVFHPHEQLHHIKKENISLIEVMGLAVLPSKLKQELDILKKAIIKKENIKSNKAISKHYNWTKEFLKKYSSLTSNNIDEIIRNEIGLEFIKALEHSGVFKRTKEGKASFDRFIDYIS